MKRLLPLLLVAALTACGPSDPPRQQANVPTVEELAADTERLKELRRQCKIERPTMCDVLWRWQGALPADVNTAQVLIVGGLPNIRVFFLDTP